MALARFWHSPRWRNLLRVDSDLAEAEGLAAGTGLLTGHLADASIVSDASCPRCGGPGEVTAIDLIASDVSRRCLQCAWTWTAVEVPVHRAS